MLEDARTVIARLLEVQSDDVIFTSGATESNALAILGIAKVGDHVLYLSSAHASVVENMKLLSERGVDIEALPIKDGRVDCEKLKGIVRPKTKLVAMDAVCGETGVVWNTREVAQVLKTRFNLVTRLNLVFASRRESGATHREDDTRTFQRRPTHTRWFKGWRARYRCARCAPYDFHHSFVSRWRSGTGIAVRGVSRQSSHRSSRRRFSPPRVRREFLCARGARAHESHQSCSSYPTYSDQRG